MNELDNANISGLRASLDELDQEIIRSIARRLELVDQIAQQKASGSAGIRDPRRERAVLERVEAAARERGISAVLARHIFSEIIAHSVTRQAAFLSPTSAADREVAVSYQGAPQSYSYLAAQKYLGAMGVRGRFTGHRTFQEAVKELLATGADLAFLPIENTTAGSINQVYDLLQESDLAIVGEEMWKVDDCLASTEEVPLSSIQRVLAHPQGFEQCSAFLASLPAAQRVICFDASEAIRSLAELRDPTQAAIGPPEAAAAHGLHVLRRGIANQTENFTRFVALARTPQRFDLRIPCKTSLIIGTRHERGALLRCLAVLSDNGLSLTKLESRPRPGRPWEYMFFIDFEGNVEDERVARSLDELRVAALYVKVLGTYPAKATAPEPESAELREGGAISAETDAADARIPAPPAPPSTPPVMRSKQYKLADRASRQEDTVVRVGNLLIGDSSFVVMAGPCSVESPAQIQSTARHVREQGAHILRGGVFKPRTSPYAFQGLGYSGLALLAAAGKASGMPIITEVMSQEQVRLVAEKADILQIGARNMQNFPLLREVGRINRPVLLKRGLSSTIEEWLAAAEYILAQGNGQVILCERGIRTFESATRNTLDLSAVVVLKERTHLPVVVDPSHGTGKRAYVAPMAWAARACGAHGLLIEVHPDPDKAMSDGDQSLTFAEFTALMQGLGGVPAPRQERR
jgi:chorismate mutase/prephenate dehydratase